MYPVGERSTSFTAIGVAAVRTALTLGALGVLAVAGRILRRLFPLDLAILSLTSFGSVAANRLRASLKLVSSLSCNERSAGGRWYCRLVLPHRMRSGRSRLFVFAKRKRPPGRSGGRFLLTGLLGCRAPPAWPKHAVSGVPGGGTRTS